jgi:CheY-like chemotaxis protein
MDVLMPGIGGIEAAEQIKAARPSTVIVLVSSTHPDDLPLQAADRYADAVIWKSLLEPRLLDEIWLRQR